MDLTSLSCNSDGRICGALRVFPATLMAGFVARWRGAREGPTQMLLGGIEAIKKYGSILNKDVLPPPHFSYLGTYVNCASQSL